MSHEKLPPYDDQQLKEIAQTEKKILIELTKTEKAIEKIKSEEVHIEEEDTAILKGVRASTGFRSKVVRRIAKHKILFTLITATAIILFWRGVWDVSSSVPVLSYPIAALLIGAVILIFIDRYSDLS